MKCPECGFECLPDDVECLACGTHIAAAIENKEKERIRSIEAAQRKAQYDLEFKKELGLIPDDEKKKTSKTEVPSLEETFKQAPLCPKCGHPRHENVGECLRCGVIFDKIGGTSNGSRIVSEPPASPPQPASPPSSSQPTVVGHEDKTAEIDLSQLKPLTPEAPQDEAVRSMPEEGDDGAGDDAMHSTESAAVDIRQAVTGIDDANDEEDEDLSNLSLVREPDSAEPVSAVPPTPEPAAASVVQPLEPAYADEKTEIIQVSQISPSKRAPVKPSSGTAGLGDSVRKTLGKIRILAATAVTAGRDQVFRLTADKKKTAKVLIALSVIVVLAVATPMGLSFYKTMKIERLKREHIRKLEIIRDDFFSRRDDISRQITLMIDNKRFDSAEKEIALYDIPLLQNELEPLKKHLTEMRLFEKARMIPAVEFEKNYLAFAELLEINPSSTLYKTKKEFYKQKLAGSEFSLAEAYAKGKNKNLTDLTKALEAIDRARSLYPESKTYALMKRKLLTEKLLYYEGNDKLVMAVQDDGMGRKLYSGQRKLTVRLKNISQETVYIRDDFFIMIGTDRNRYVRNDTGRSFKTKLLPGEETRGELYFRTKARPAEIIFDHKVVGAISRVFPD
ncbi:hypothetical protein JCM14469_06790 [Desulfatiferula olefinivorans]